MKPRNDKEREIAELSATLQPIEIDTWDAIDYIDTQAIDCMCYNASYYCNGVQCGWGTYMDEVNYPVIQRVVNYDVWRIFQLEFRKRHIGSFPKTRMSEVAQIWFDEHGNKYVMRKKFRYTKAEYWWYGSKMEYRGKELALLNDGSYALEKPTLRIMSTDADIFRKKDKVINQYNSIFSKSEYYHCECKNVNHIEYALSAKAEWFFKLSNEFYADSYGSANKDFVKRADKWFDSIKIANRHGYDWHSDFLLWTDMLMFIDEYGGDTHNPQVICPIDLKESHYMWQKRVERKREKARQEKMLEEARKGNMDYLKSHGAYLAIAFGSNLSNLQFHVIQSAEEMVMEGIKMHHCVGHYWRDHDSSLIFSCRLPNGDRHATIEVNTESMSIVQIRGIKNEEPEYLDEINKTITEHMNVIREAKLASVKIKSRRATKKALAV